MNKDDVVSMVAQSTGMSKSDAAKAVNAVFDSITAALQAGQEVKIVGFGNFNVSKRAATVGRNPRTGERINIAPSNTPKFRTGKALKDAVRAALDGNISTRP